MLEKQQPCGQVVSGLQSTSSIPGRSQPWLNSPCCFLGQERHLTLTLTMPHSSNNITFGGFGGTHTCKNRVKPQYLTVRIIFTFIDSVCLIFHRRNLAKLLKIRATIRPHSAEVTANSNTLDVFQYKTNNNKDGRSYTSVYNHSHAPQSFTNIAGC